MCEITGYYRPDMHLEGILAVGHEISCTTDTMTLHGSEMADTFQGMVKTDSYL